MIHTTSFYRQYQLDIESSISIFNFKNERMELMKTFAILNQVNYYIPVSKITHWIIHDIQRLSYAHIKVSKLLFYCLLAFKLKNMSISLVHLPFESYFIKLVLVITCLGGRFRINYRSAFLKFFKNHKGDLSQKSPKSNM